MIKAPESLHEKIRAIFRPLWKGYVDGGNERAKKLIEAEIKKRAAENKVLAELARADLESNIKPDPERTERTKETGRPIRG